MAEPNVYEEGAVIRLYRQLGWRDQQVVRRLLELYVRVAGRQEVSPGD